MPATLLLTKLNTPPARPDIVSRQRLVERLDRARHCRLTLLSAPAGFGKTTLVSEWAAGQAQKVAWVSLDEGDSDPASFLTYLVAGLQTIDARIGAGVPGALQGPQPPPMQAILAALLNEITSMPGDFVLVLDDYHVTDSKPVDEVVAFLLEHLPPQMHLVIASREDPSLPLARLRARGQLAELRAADLRFTPAEAAEFLKRVMDLDLSEEELAALETRTEGWIAGLQLAALSMQGQDDTAGFIRSFTGSHQFILDYLVEEVLQRQPENVQAFLLRTSILERLCGPLCDAVLCDPAVHGQETLEALERDNLFLVPLDNERRWYRYHHLFRDLLRQRSGLNLEAEEIAGSHIRASKWFERNGLALEAFQHAAAAGDIERAERLADEMGLQQHVQGVNALLGWLGSLPKAALDARPSLWVKAASALVVGGHTSDVEEKLQAAEAALQGAGLDDKTRDLVGQMAAIRSMLAISQYDVEGMFNQARRALEYLHPGNHTSRFRALLSLANACELRGDREGMGQSYREALSVARASGNVLYTGAAQIGLGETLELGNQLHEAAEHYRSALQVADEPLPPIFSYAQLGLARILYEWNDLEAAGDYGRQSLQLSRQYDPAMDRFVISEVFLARLQLARGDVGGAAATLAGAERTAHEKNFTLRLPEIAAIQVLVLLRQGNFAVAGQLAGQHDLPQSRARVLIARGEPGKALALLEPLRRQMEARGWADELLRVMVLQAVALHLQGDKESAARVLGEVLEKAEPGGFIRLFVDEGAPMRTLLRAAAEQGMRPGYVSRLLAAFDAEAPSQPPAPGAAGKSPLIEPLSPREMEVLRLVAQGLSNQAIGERLYLALDTVKGHNRRIFDKLQVQNRTEAIARARELGLL